MHPEIVRAHQPHGIGLLLVLFALAGAAFGTLVAPGEVVAPTSAPAPACTPSPGANAAASSTPPTESPCPTPTRPTAEPTAIPTPRPTPRPTATPIPSPSPTPSPASPSRLVRHGSRTSGAVALTFDMGGRIGDALAIMDWLVAHEVRASVFMTGAMAASPNTDAGRSVLAIVDAHPDLFTLGNHSYTHRDFRTLTAAQIADELRRTEAAIAPYCTHGLRPFFRPPNGGYDAGVLAAVGAAGYRYTVTWDVDTIDWRPVANDPPGPTADQIVAKVLGNARDGTIVLMHLGGYETFEALPRIVDGLRANGLRPVTLDELL
jgi:peptidoglycan/xylan/chitin deacetylase (PgdA/CDA1 family)